MIETPEFDNVTRAKAERWGPRFVYTPPNFKNKYEAQKYKEQEEQRWYEGYGGLDGMYYKYLTQYKMKNVQGEIIRPYWRDGDDYIVSKTTSSCLKNGNDKFTLKRREYGLSSWDGGFMPLEIAQRYPGCNIKMTSYNEDALKVLMENKIEVMGQHVYQDSEAAWQKVMGSTPLWRPNIKYRNSDQTLHIDFGGDIRSTIAGIQTSKGPKSAKKMEGDRLMYAFIDEFFLHEFANKVRLSADAARREGFSKAGMISLGGSAGDSTEDGAKRAQDLWYNHQAYGIEIVFLPATLCISKAEELDDRGVKTGRIISFMVNGYSLQQEAYEWIGKTRTVLESLSDKTAYWQFVKQYPLHVEEVFETTSDNLWDVDEKRRFESQKKRIFVSETYRSVPMALQSDLTGTVRFERNASSPIKIIEEPKTGFNYIMGIDPIPIITRAESDKRSDYAAVVKCLETNMYVAYYTERSKDSSRLFNKTFLLQKAYNNALAMIERNRADAIIGEYERRGCRNFLANEPLPLRPAGAKTVEVGYSKNIHNADDLTDNLLAWARHYDEEKETGGIESIWDDIMLDQVYTLDSGNKDIADAMVSCELLHWWILEKAARKQRLGKYSSFKKKVPVKRLVNGVLQIQWVDVETFQNKFPNNYKLFSHGGQSSDKF